MLLFRCYLIWGLLIEVYHEPRILHRYPISTRAWKGVWPKPLKNNEKLELTQSILVDLNHNQNTGGTVVPEIHGCSYKTFMNCKPHSFKGTEGVVGLKRWFEKIEQVFEICKCAEDDKVKFAMCTFEGRALTWWNGNVQTLGLANANQILVAMGFESYDDD
ncbi:hypothetical protein Tco_0005809 [Tanacetum coccineum]